MIFLTPDQLREVEYLINQSRAGVHHLFNSKEIKNAFKRKDVSPDGKLLERIKTLFFAFISQADIKKKRRFFLSLNDLEQVLIIRTYFNIVENELIESQTFLI